MDTMVISMKKLPKLLDSFQELPFLTVEEFEVSPWLTWKKFKVTVNVEGGKLPKGTLVMEATQSHQDCEVSYIPGVIMTAEGRVI